jgi:hypothetical protein
MPISSLDLSVRASNCLASANISTVGMLIQWDEASLLKIRSFGKTSLREIKRKLVDRGLALRSDETAGAETTDDGTDEGEDEQFDIEDKASPMADYLAGPGATSSTPPVEYPPSQPAPSAAPDTGAPVDKEVGVTGEAAG